MHIHSETTCPYSYGQPTSQPSYQRFLDVYFSREKRRNCDEECATQICALMHFIDPKCDEENEACNRCSNHFLREKITRFVSFVERENMQDSIEFAERIGDPKHARGAVLAAQQLILWAGVIDRLG